ncbi:MAG TPA: hypothetical protein VJ045_07550 [Hyphomicrobiaceae bacterium]|nr:hypothetical protein [Hyphomicrobiaceae bacterium]
MAISIRAPAAGAELASTTRQNLVLCRLRIMWAAGPGAQIVVDPIESDWGGKETI